MTSLTLTVQALERACELNRTYVELLERIQRAMWEGASSVVESELETAVPALRQVHAAVEAQVRQLAAEVNSP